MKAKGINKNQVYFGTNPATTADRSLSDDKYARFLTGYTTARWLAQSEGLDDLANELVPVLHSVQNAHDQILNREAQLMVLKLLHWLRAGKLRGGTLKPSQLAELFGISLAALRKLEQKLITENQPEPCLKADVASQATSAEVHRAQRPKRKVDIVSPATASEIRRTLRIGNATERRVRKALKQAGVKL